MNHRTRPSLAAVVLSLALAACGGGRGDAPADVSPNPAPPVVASGSLIDFLLFPNPLKQSDGTAQTNTVAYAESYYAAIDPGNERTTFVDWKNKNGFDGATGRQATAVFGDFRDLGYGRRMTARHNSDGTIAFFVENYLVDTGGGGYGSGLNLDAAIVQDRRWQANVNAIEFSPGPGGTVKFAKFFSFDPVTGKRRLEQDIDGRGPKSLPGLCISCHGGRADALEPLGAAAPPARFAFLANSAELQQRGDTRGKLHVFEVDALTFSNRPGFTRPEQEAALKAMNEIVLCSYPIVGAPPVPPPPSKNACRPPATANDTEWQGTAATLIQGAYGGSELPNDNYAEPAVAAGWLTRAALYTGVVVPACRSCHIVRGTGGPLLRQSDIDLTTFAKFDSYADRIKAHVFDRGNMPLARIVFDKFWNSGMADQLAAYLDAKGPTFAPARDATGHLLRPGRPIADPGPDRAVRTGVPVKLSATASLYANRYQWRIVSGGGSLFNPSSATPTYTTPANGISVLELVASNANTSSAPMLVKLYSDAAFPDPAGATYTAVQLRLDGACAGCHGKFPSQPPTSFDRLDPGAFDRVRGLVNLTDIAASPLLRKPSGSHHSANPDPLINFDIRQPDTLNSPGQASRTDYDLFLNWALSGAPNN